MEFTAEYRICGRRLEKKRRRIAGRKRKLRTPFTHCSKEDSYSKCCYVAMGLVHDRHRQQSGNEPTCQGCLLGQEQVRVGREKFRGTSLLSSTDFRCAAGLGRSSHSSGPGSEC